MAQGAELAHLVVPERGDVEVETAVWQRLSRDPGFWALVDRKYLNVKPIARDRVVISGTCYVGRAIAGGVSITVVPKVAGALGALISFASSGAFRVERIEAEATEMGELASLLIHEFVCAATSYASKGRRWEYRRHREVRSLVGGRLDITRSLHLRARGLGHLLAFERDTLVFNVPLNRIVFAALREVERLTSLLPVNAADVRVARGLSLLFSDCRDAEILFGRREVLADLAEKLAYSLEQPEERDLASLAGILLAHGSFELSDVIIGRSPRSWFLNLETLFEAAVRSVLRRMWAPGVKVVRGSTEAPPIFELGRGRYTANPDLSLQADTAAVAVGDVKYKEWPSKADEGDLYQLIVHARAFDVPEAFLIYAGEGFMVEDLGRAVTGCRTQRFAVNVLRLDADLRQAMEHIGFRQAPESAGAAAVVVPG